MSVTRYTDLKTWGSTSLWIYSLAQPFTTNQVGNIFTIQSGLGWLPGNYYCKQFISSYDVGPDGNQAIALLHRIPTASGNNEVISGGVGFTRPALPTPLLDGKTFVFDGNSITEGFGLPNSAVQSYPVRALDRLQLFPDGTPNLNYHNFGVAGQRISAMAADFDNQVAPLLSENSIYMPFEFVNTLSDPDSTAAGAVQEYRELCLRAKDRGSMVISCEPTPRTLGNTSADNAYETKRQAAIDLLRSSWSEFANAHISLGDDFRVGMVNSNFNTVYFQNDYVHTNPAGADAIAEAYALAIPEALRGWTGGGGGNTDFDTLYAAVLALGTPQQAGQAVTLPAGVATSQSQTALAAKIDALPTPSAVEDIVGAFHADPKFRALLLDALRVEKDLLTGTGSYYDGDTLVATRAVTNGNDKITVAEPVYE